MAVRWQVFTETGVAQRWKNAISDDYALSAAIHAAGLTIAWAPGALVPSREPAGAARFFRWGRRQMAITRVSNPRLWRQALAAHVVYCAGMAASAAALVEGHRDALWLLAAQLAPGMWKAARRATLAAAAVPESRRYQWAHVLLAPPATWAWLALLAASAFGGTVEWRGRRYRLSRSRSARS